MVTFEFQTPVSFTPSLFHKQWIKAIIRREGLVPGDITYQFCDDAYLLERNIFFLNHDTLTDIITFDKCFGEIVSGDIMISAERIVENAEIFHVGLEREYLRVLAHGVLHLCGYKDKSAEEAVVMRQKEEEAMLLYDTMRNL